MAKKKPAPKSSPRTPRSKKSITESISYDTGSYQTGWGPFWNDPSEYGAFQFPNAGMGGWVNPAQLAVRDNYLSGEQLPIYLSWWQLKSIRDRARFVFATNEFAHGLVQCFQSFVVGSAGFKWRVASIDLKNPVPEDLLKRCQASLDIFREYNGMVDVENEIVYRLHVDGEVFIRKFPQANGMLVIRFIEPELVRGYATDIGSPKDSFGIICEEDDINSVLGYQVILKPTESREPTFIPADEIIHIKIGTNSNAKRGLTTFYPVFQNLTNCEDILASTVTMAKARAKIAMIRKVNNVAPDSMASLVDSQIDATLGGSNNMGATENIGLERFGYGSIITAPANIDYEFPGANVDAAGLIQVLQANLRSLATRFGISETLMSGDASNNNYSSALIAEAPARRTFERWQGIVGRSLAECRFEPNKSLAWSQIHLASEHGIIPKEILKNIKITSEAYSLQSREHQKEAEMNNVYHSMGVKSIQTIRSELGLDNDTEASNFIKPIVDEKKGATEIDPMNPSSRVESGNTTQGIGGGEQVQDSALNGAQIANLVDIIHRCTIGEIPMESGKAIARASFPAITPEIIDLMFRDVVVKIPEPVQPVSSSSAEKLDSTEPPPNLPAAKAPKTSTVTG
jgi:hypothetical protein